MTDNKDSWLDNILSISDCNEILEKKLHTKSFTTISFDLKPLQYQLNGLFTEQCILRINYQLDSKEEVQKFFVKVIKETHKILSQIAKHTLAYEKETTYYTKLISELKEHELPYQFVPNCYLCKYPTVVLEDLTLIRYKPFEKLKPLDFEQCRIGLDTLVEFHAGPMTLEQKKSQELGRKYKLTEDYGDILKDKFFLGYITTSMKNIWKILEVIPESGVNKTDFRTKLEAIVDGFKNIEGQDSLASTVLHADLWSSNFLYLTIEDEIQDFKLIDFQTIYYGPPGNDVVQFLMTNTPFEFYKQHKEELLEYYYAKISNVLKAYDLEPSGVLPKEQFKKTCDDFEIRAKLFATIDHCITGLPDEILKKGFDSENFEDFMFLNKDKYILEGFAGNESYRKLITSDVYDLMSMV